MTTTRIYRIADGDTVRLVDAANAAQAVRYCAAQRYHVSVAKPKDLAHLIAKGTKVEVATPEQLAIVGMAE